MDRQKDVCTTNRQFQFISVQTSNEGNKAARRLARSHAVKQALQDKRKLEKQSMKNFRVMAFKSKPRKAATPASDTPTPRSISSSKLDPFETLGVDSSRLQSFLDHREARKAPEPVFSTARGVAFQNFKSVFRAGFVDPAVLSASMLSFVFTVNGGSINQECLVYQSQAMHHIRERLNSMTTDIVESTIGAILLLVGVEVRLGATSQIQIHMGAVQVLLRRCQAAGININAGIKRAIFWQDLNASIVTGSNRIVDHNTFTDLHWSREYLPSDWFQLPPGFHCRSQLLAPECLEVLEDIHALQRVREDSYFRGCGQGTLACINAHTASIQSRLVELQAVSSVSKACYLAAYLCSVMLCCKIWCELVIPPHVASQLLHELQRSENDEIWEDHTDLLVWLICIGGAFSPVGTQRSGYTALWRSKTVGQSRRLGMSWAEVYAVLNHFIWSDVAFLPHVKRFHEETCSSSRSYRIRDDMGH